MTPEQAELIRKSFDAMGLARRRIADLCYQRLFGLAPEALTVTEVTTPIGLIVALAVAPPGVPPLITTFAVV